MGSHLSGRGLLGAVIIVGVSLASAGSAYAVPPPPSFSDFVIQNTSGYDVTQIELWFYPSDEDDRRYLQSPTVLIVPRVRNGRKMTVSLSSGERTPPDGLWGVGRIEVRAATCTGAYLSRVLQINAQMYNFEGGPNVIWSGFSGLSPSGGNNYAMKLDFMPGVVRLHAKWRYGDHWPDGQQYGNESYNWPEAVAQDSVPFCLPPDEGCPRPCPCPCPRPCLR